MQLQKAEGDLQVKEKHIESIETSLKPKSSDASTQFLYSDVAECKSETFRFKILRHILLLFHRRFDWSQDMWRNDL